MKSRLFQICSLALVCWAVQTGAGGPVFAAIRVDFDQDEYIVFSPGDTITARVLMDADDSTDELDPLPNGLFSFGAQVTFDPTKASIGGLADIQITPALDHFGFSAGGFKETGAGLAAAKGNVDSNSLPIEPFDETLLMTLTLTNQASAVDAYTLSLDFFRTLPPSEDLFVDAMLNKLDSQVTFGSARVRVIPEPHTPWVAAMAALLMALQYRLMMKEPIVVSHTGQASGTRYRTRRARRPCGPF
jgi:hypothetical protein